MAGDKSGRTPLHLAAGRGHTTLVREMLTYFEGDYGPTEESSDLLYDLLHAETSKGYTALHVAATRNDRETAKVLLDWGTNPTRKCRGKELVSNHVFVAFGSCGAIFQCGVCLRMTRACGAEGKSAMDISPDDGEDASALRALLQAAEGEFALIARFEERPVTRLTYTQC